MLGLSASSEAIGQECKKLLRDEFESTGSITQSWSLDIIKSKLGKAEG
jgi:hypothetical protein